MITVEAQSRTATSPKQLPPYDHCFPFSDRQALLLLLFKSLHNDHLSTRATMT